jgi:hypothetical protein
MANRPLYGPQVKYGSTDAQRQQAMAQLLLKEGVDTSPVRGGIGEALARIGTAGIGGYLSNQAGETEKAYNTDRAQTLARALSAGQGMENAPGPNIDGSAGVNVPPDPNRMAQILMGNPSTADLGSQLAIGNMTFARDRAAKKEDTADERGFRKELFGMERQAKLEDTDLSQRFQREMAQIDQAFRSGQMTAQQAFQAAENAKNRAQQMEVAQLNRVPDAFVKTDTGLAPIPGGPADPAYLGQKTEATAGAKMNDEQSKAAGYADRIREALPVIDKFSSAGTDITQKALSSIPGGNFLVSPEYQQLDQAKRNFVNAILRRESGAVISDSEFANADKQYFPQPGDSQEVLSQKKRNREDAITSLTRSAGPAYKAPKADTGGWKIELVK